MYSFNFSPYYPEHLHIKTFDILDSSTGVEVLIFEINQRHILVTLLYVFSHLETLLFMKILSKYVFKCVWGAAAAEPHPELRQN